MNARGFALGLLALLVFAHPELAEACSALVQVQVKVVAHAHARGPFVFLLVCGGPNLKPCSKAPPDVRVRLGSMELAGTTRFKADLPNRGQLVEWTPVAELQAGVVYQAVTAEAFAEGVWQNSSASFQLGPDGATAPFERMAASAQWTEVEAGSHYSCSLSFDSFPSGCTQQSLGWSTEGYLQPTLSLSHGPEDGWLFRSASGLTTVQEWDPDPTCSTEISPSGSEVEGWSVQACIRLDAWNVIDGTKLQRDLCASAPMKTEAERHLPRPTPELKLCVKAPRRSGDSSPAFELRQAWCSRRALYCAGLLAADCIEYAALCEPRVADTVGNAAVSQSDAGTGRDPSRGGEAREGAADVSSDEQHANTSDDTDEPSDAGGGCSVSRGATPRDAWWFVLTGVVLWTWRRLTRSRAGVHH
jgi:hypothetical protein